VVFAGDVVGTVVYRGKITPFLSLLRAGEVLHVGRGTVFGQGRYRLVTVKPSERPVTINPPVTPAVEAMTESAHS
jgi:hypothetical protein